MKTKVQRKNLNSNAKLYKQEKGITLIALVVTIVIMLILAGVTIKLALDDNGVIENAKDAKNQYEQAQADEDSGLNDLSSEMKKLIEENKKRKFRRFYNKSRWSSNSRRICVCRRNER